MARIELENLTKVFPDGTRAVSGLDLEIDDEEFVVLVGPSGCGKTTALRMVAGLEEITDGHVRIGDRVVDDLPPKARDIAMVFQNYALYPHMSSYDNMAFGLKMRGEGKGVIRRRVDGAAGLLGLAGTLEKKPRTLSGGQRQRVAMGRSIVREPQAFLMDEPLSNLDAKLRVQMRAEISRLQRDLGVTTIYVTHDQVEAMTMGDRVAVMHDGVLQQVERPQVLYDRPANLFVAGFIGSPAMNMVEAELEQADGRLAVRIGDDRLAFGGEVAETHPDLARHVGRTVVIGIRPEDLEDAAVAGGGGDGRTISTTVDLREDMGSEVFLHFAVDAAPVRTREVLEAVGVEAIEAAEGESASRGTPFIARVDRTTRAQEGSRVDLVVDTRHLHFFDPETGAGIYREGKPAAA
ncbi:MAG TPA: sn-glycerol-3-phosphate ABC transporter ATP-binding protein UgpC [Gaiellaceae bacterium]|nr:sn-glycerol-3-phosphate ABC transporter ATP-binding protein UgpC [Gaiellaceae bacterium]